MDTFGIVKMVWIVTTIKLQFNSIPFLGTYIRLWINRFSKTFIPVKNVAKRNVIRKSIKYIYKLGPLK